MVYRLSSVLEMELRDEHFDIENIILRKGNPQIIPYGNLFPPKGL